MHGGAVPVARSRGVSLTGERYLLVGAILDIVLSAVTGLVIARFAPFWYPRGRPNAGR